MAQHAVPAPFTISGFNSDNETAKLGLKEVIIDSASQIRDFTPMFYKKNTQANELTFKKKIYAGFPRAASWSHTLENISAASMQFLWDVDATHAWYGIAGEMTKEEIQFDPYGINGRIPTEIGKGLGEMKQVLTAQFFNDAFATTAWEDGVYFFSASHPYSSSATGDSRGTTQSNLVTGTASVSVAAEAINKMINQRDSMGRPLNIRPRRLVCYPTAVMLWKQVLASAAEYGTANRNESPFKDYGNIEVVGYDWLDSATKWFLMGDKYDTYFSEPVGIETKVKDTDANGRRIEGWFTIAYWAERWQGYVGGLGT